MSLCKDRRIKQENRVRDNQVNTIFPTVLLVYLYKGLAASPRKYSNWVTQTFALNYTPIYSPLAYLFNLAN